jgi:hypothetical protein
LIEVLASADRSTWTIVVTWPLRRSWLVATGEGWRTIEQIRAAPEILMDRTPAGSPAW